MAYDSSWQDRFEKVAAALSGALADGPPANVEHVGSTSVPGLAAKPILDIDVIVAPEDVPAGVTALVRIGYRLLAASDLTDAERRQILSLNDPSR